MRHRQPLLATSITALALLACRVPEGDAAGGAPSDLPNAVPAEPGEVVVVVPARDAQRAANDAVYGRERARLASEAAGRWTLIAGGELLGSWSTFDAAWSAAEAQAADALHAYLFRPGIDDGDVEFVLSPFRIENARWTQMGVRLRRPFKLTMQAAGDVWYRRVEGQVLQAAWGDAGARYELTSPDGARVDVVRGVASNLFQQDISLTEASARALGLGRFEAPGRAWYARPEWPCRKVVLRVRIPELQIDAPAVGFVLPASLTKEWPGAERWSREILER